MNPNYQEYLIQEHCYGRFYFSHIIHHLDVCNATSTISNISRLRTLKFIHFLGSIAAESVETADDKDETKNRKDNKENDFFLTKSHSIFLYSYFVIVITISCDLPKLTWFQLICCWAVKLPWCHMSLSHFISHQYCQMGTKRILTPRWLSLCIDMNMSYNIRRKCQRHILALETR